jgi:hypothetical protein
MTTAADKEVVSTPTDMRFMDDRIFSVLFCD